MVTLYGIANCDTVRRARKWLESRGIEFRFHDLHKDGITRAQVHEWSESIGWEPLLNRRGTTWRKLSDSSKAGLTASKAEKLMTEHPTLIKRPVLQLKKGWHVGFDAEQYDTLFR